MDVTLALTTLSNEAARYTGEIGPAVLEQLKTAHGRYGTEGKILSLIVMTTAERMSAGLAEISARAVLK
jgi:hypothetical protein